MSEHLQSKKLELIHGISDLVDKSGLWCEIARLGMTREFIEQRECFFARIIMELDFIEKQAPDVAPEVKELRSLAAMLFHKEQHRYHASASNA